MISFYNCQVCSNLMISHELSSPHWQLPHLLTITTYEIWWSAIFLRLNSSAGWLQCSSTAGFFKGLDSQSYQYGPIEEYQWTVTLYYSNCLQCKTVDTYCRTKGLFSRKSLMWRLPTPTICRRSVPAGCNAGLPGKRFLQQGKINKKTIVIV